MRMRLCLLSGPNSPHWHLFIRGCLERGHQVIHLVYGNLPEEPIATPSQNFITFSLIDENQNKSNPGGQDISESVNRSSLAIARKLMPSGGRAFLEKMYALYVGYGFLPSPGRVLALMPEDINYHLTKLEICAARATELLKQIRPDILLGSFMTNAGYIAARTGFRPFLAEAHGDDVLIRPNQSFIMRMILRYVMRRADSIRSHAECITQRLLFYGGSKVIQKVTTFPWGVDLQVFVPNELRRNEMRKRLGWRNKLVLIMTRFFEPVYGIEYFIDALPSVVASRPEMCVILVGSGSLEEALRHRVGAHGLERHVLFTGRLCQIEEVAPYLNTADVYVSTSLSEGASTSLQEAMACALPVVVSDAPGNLEWVKDGVNGYVVPRGDSNTLAKRLIALLGQESLRREMGCRNLELARRKANWEENLTRLEQVCASLIGGAQSSIREITCAAVRLK